MSKHVLQFQLFTPISDEKADRLGVIRFTHFPYETDHCCEAHVSIGYPHELLVVLNSHYHTAFFRRLASHYSSLATSHTGGRIVWQRLGMRRLNQIVAQVKGIQTHTDPIIAAVANELTTAELTALPTKFQAAVLTEPRPFLAFIDRRLLQWVVPSPSRETRIATKYKAVSFASERLPLARLCYFSSFKSHSRRQYEIKVVEPDLRAPVRFPMVATPTNFDSCVIDAMRAHWSAYGAAVLRLDEARVRHHMTETEGYLRRLFNPVTKLKNGNSLVGHFCPEVLTLGEQIRCYVAHMLHVMFPGDQHFVLTTAQIVVSHLSPTASS